jgi:hypothetical protein
MVVGGGQRRHRRPYCYGVEEVKVEPWDSFPLLLDQRGGWLQMGGHRHPRLQRHRLSQADVWFNFSFTLILFKFVKYV